ncbi:hypothetical protein KQJ27_25050, partial [Pluralibacter sp. S54_ASV_43]|nr:hypothetical protein [Pluralibacter sp. S54_ASV_43]
QYIDRFGKSHYTIEGLKQIVLQQIYNLGWNLNGTFQGGGTVTSAGDLLQDETTNIWYRWDDIQTLPKNVPVGSTPETAGGIGDGLWQPVDITDVLRRDLFSEDDGKGDALITVKQPFPGAVERTQHSKNTDYISVLDFGAKGDGVTDDSVYFQAAIDATPWGGVLQIPTPSAYYNISTSLRIDKPITIYGNGGSTVSRKQMPCLKFPVGINGFVLVPTYDGFRFTYGITGVVIRNIMLEGVSNVSTDWAGYAFSVDETVNGGDYHVRECSFENIHVRYFDHAFTLRGSVYLNNFIGVRALWCGVGVRIDRNGSGFGYSDQNRFFGCEFVLNQSGIILSAVGHAGSQTIHGCTISENTIQGAVFGYNVTLSFVGNTVEKNPVGLTILIPSTVTNPASECAKTISGNWFLINTVAILVSKSTTVLTGGFAFPVLIEGNSFNQTVNEVLKVVAPSGAGEFDSRQFIFSSSNSYSATGETLGPVPDSKISSAWAGYNGFHEDGKITISARVNGTAVTNAGFFIVPAGHQCYVKYTMLSIPTLAANGRDQTVCD